MGQKKKEMVVVFGESDSLSNTMGGAVQQPVLIESCPRGSSSRIVGYGSNESAFQFSCRHERGDFSEGGDDIAPVG